jgi:hypothetical protein
MKREEIWTDFNKIMKSFVILDYIIGFITLIIGLGYLLNFINLIPPLGSIGITSTYFFILGLPCIILAIIEFYSAYLLKTLKYNGFLLSIILLISVFSILLFIYLFFIFSSFSYEGLMGGGVMAYSLIILPFLLIIGYILFGIIENRKKLSILKEILINRKRE